LKPTIVGDDDLVCPRGSRLINGKRLWDERPKWIKYSAEAKKRGLSCGVASTSSTTNLNYSNNEICERASYGVERKWLTTSSVFYKYVVEAKRRGLSCGVGSNSSSIKTSSECSSSTLKICSNDLVCKRGTIQINGTRIWDERSKWIKYSVEAKKRNLSCGIISSNLTTKLNYTDNYICDRAAPPSNSGIRKWLTSGFIDYKYVVIARKRNLSCGVALISSTTITSSNNDICVSATQGVGAEKRWRKVSSAFYQSVVEAKKRGLTCGIRSISSSQVARTSDLPDCPSSKNAYRHNCFGTFTYFNGDKYIGEFKDDTRSGQGTYTYGPEDKWSGDEYIGEWRDGEKDGQGIYTYANGKVLKGTWKVNVFQYTKTPPKAKTIAKTAANIQTCSTDVDKCNKAQLCGRASYFTGSQHLWDKSKSSKVYVLEAKKRGLSCGVVLTRSKTKTSSTCSVKNLEVCSNKLLCSRGSRTVNGERLWDERPKWIKYSAEAKKRNLTCGVKVISSTAKVVSPCSINNTEACNNNYVCQFATSGNTGKKAWHISNHSLYQYVNEAKKRGLTCGVKVISSTAKVVSPCSITNTKACNDNYVCQFATSGNAGKKAWYKKDQSLYRYVTEAKKRGLTCGVKAINSKTKTSSACSKTNTKTCTDYLLCRFSTITDAGKQVWFESDHIMYPYVIEAKKRNLSCGIKSSG
jgi:hypothetical protein